MTTGSEPPVPPAGGGGVGGNPGGGGAVAPPPTTPALPAAQITKPRRPTLIWLVPLAALLAAGFLVFQALSERGRVIRIRFDTGGGIQVNDPVMYRGMHVGRIRSVTLTPDLGGVLVTAEMRPDASSLAVTGSKFWIVHPVVSFSRVSGLDTLLGPKYVEVEPGADRSAHRTDFVGLEREPITPRVPRASSTQLTSGGGGELTLLLNANVRPSVNVGSPVLYRGVKVGSVIAFDLSDSGQAVEVTIIVEGRYANLVRSNTVFYNASGVDLAVSLAGGLSLRASSLESVLAGGVEFSTPDKPGTRVQNGATFPLSTQPPKGAAEWSPDLSEATAP